MIGLLGADPSWRQLARQEGIEPAVEALDHPGIRVLVVDRRPDKAECRAIDRLLSRGAGVLTDAEFGGALMPDLHCSPARVRYIVPERSPLFTGVGIVDLEIRGWRIRGAAHGRLNNLQGAVLATEHLGGRVVVLPFRVSDVLSDARSAVRVFESEAPKPVYERVARVNRGEVRRLVAGCWRWLLSGQGLGYVHQSYVPAGSASCFGFRVDTDFGLKANILKTIDLARQTGLRMSWFLNTRAHVPELGELLDAGLREQDVQLHCYDHRVFPDLESNRANLDQGRAMLERCGVQPVGVAAPYGDWNSAWQRALEEVGFLYGSDFGISYDDLPFRPIIDGRESGVLQVPCHPMSPGRLRSCRAGSREMVDYFARHVELCVLRHEPALFYGHPGPVSELAGALTKVIEVGLQRAGCGTTYTEYARWWLERERTRPSVLSSTGQVEVRAPSAGESQALVIELPGRRAELPLRSGRYSLDELDWQVEEPLFVRTSAALAARRRTWQARIRQRLRDRLRQT